MLIINYYDYQYNHIRNANYFFYDIFAQIYVYYIVERVACGPMDKAPDFGSGACRFESCHARSSILQILLECA